MGAVKATKLVFIYINSRTLKYKWTLEERKKQKPTLLTLSEKQEVEIENANIESTSDLIEATIELEVEYADNIATGTRNYFKIEDDNVRELVPEIEIGKLVSLGYFDNQ